MSTIKMIVPVDGSSREVEGWTGNIDQYISAGNNVEFIDSQGKDVNINKILIASTKGNDKVSVYDVCIFGKGYGPGTAKVIPLITGQFHIVNGMHGICCDGTSADITIRVKI